MYHCGQMAEYISLRKKIILEIRKEKQNYYCEEIKPARSNQKQWWKNIKNITGIKSKQEFILSNPQFDTQLNTKDTVYLMNDYFTSLTSNYLKVHDNWFNVGIEEQLPNITAEAK